MRLASLLSGPGRVALFSGVAAFLLSYVLLSFVFRPELPPAEPITYAEENLSMEQLEKLLAISERRRRLTGTLGQRGKVDAHEHCLQDTGRGLLRGLYPASENLPLYVFVAGIEGAGHGLLAHLFEQLRDRAPVRLVQPSDNVHRVDETQQRPFQYTNINLGEQLQHVRALAEQAFARQEILVDVGSTFPMSADGGSLHSPDLLHLLMLDGVLFDLRVVVLQRDPVHAVQSGVRRHYSSTMMLFKTLEYQARIAEENLAYLSNALKHVPCEHLLRIDFECFVHDTTQFYEQLASMLSLPLTMFDGLAPPAYKAGSNDVFYKSDQQILQEFLASHAPLWPGIGEDGLSAPALAAARMRGATAGDSGEAGASARMCRRREPRGQDLQRREMVLVPKGVL